MELGLRGKIALVAASSHGLGKAIAEHLAAEGASVVVCSRNKKTLLETAKEISGKTKAEVVPIPADLARAREIGRLVRRVMQKFGTLHILVNNAGGPPVETFERLSDDQWDHGVELTLMSAVRLTRAVIPVMQRQRWGRIIFMNSFVSKQPASDLIISSTLRPGLIGLNKALANQFGKEGILINTVCPGYILTKRQEEISRVRAEKAQVSKEEYLASLSLEIPLRRYGTPDEVADLVTFLSSERASYITGTTIGVDGGIVRGLL